MKSKVSPGQISLFCPVVYNNKNYKSLKEAMISAMQDFYIKKKYPPKINNLGKTYNLKNMRRFWLMNELFDQYVY